MVNENNSSGSCSCNSGCCGTTQDNTVDKRSIAIDFLYLDLSVCSPCQGTESVLDEAIKDVAKVLESTGVDAVVNKINVTNEEQAIKYKFVSSPTIRINGRDIQLEVKESSCKTCSDLSGEETDCRIWVYQGKEFSVPPKAMIIEAILKEVYGGNDNKQTEQDYIMPENLKRFYAAMNEKDKDRVIVMKKVQIFEPAMCCPTGLCGIGVDPELLRMSTLLKALQKNGIEVDRFNLTSAPMEFISNKAINELLNSKGVDELPAIVVDGDILITGRYPSNEEFTRLLDIPSSYLTEEPNPFNIIEKKSDCGCSDGSCC